MKLRESMLMSSRSYWPLMVFIVLLLLFVGCNRAAQMAAPNRKLSAALQTAVSARNTGWLEGVAKQVEEKHESGDLSETEFAALDAVITRAKSGDWKGAQKDSFALSEGQRPTSEDLARLRERQPVDR